MSRIWIQTVLFTMLGALVFILVVDNSADACHRHHRRRCNGGCYGGGSAYQGKYGGTYYGGGAYYGGAPVAPYGDRAYGSAEFGATGPRSARGTVEGGADARVDGALRSPSDRIRAGAGVEGRTDIDGAGAGARAGARGGAGAPPPPTDDSTLPPPRSERPAEPSSPPSSDRPAEPSAPPSNPDEA